MPSMENAYVFKTQIWLQESTDYAGVQLQILRVKAQKFEIASKDWNWTWTVQCAWLEYLRGPQCATAPLRCRFWFRDLFSSKSTLYFLRIEIEVKLEALEIVRKLYWVHKVLLFSCASSVAQKVNLNSKTIVKWWEMVQCDCMQISLLDKADCMKLSTRQIAAAGSHGETMFNGYQYQKTLRRAIESSWIWLTWQLL